MAVTKSLEQERAVGEYEKQSCLFRFDRTQCTIGSALPNDPLAYRIQHLASRERFPYNAERLKTTLIRSAADLDTPGRIGHALADGELCGHELAMSGRFSPNVESARIVDCRLDPQHAALFVVHFDRHRHPHLKSNVHQAEFTIGKVEVKEQACSSGRGQHQSLAFSISTEGKRLAGLDTRQHANQASAIPILLHDGSSIALFR